MIGGCTVKELLGRIDSEELGEWMAWREIRGPFGECRADLRMGILAREMWAIAVAMRGKKSKLKAGDFMPFVDKPAEKPQTTAQQLALIGTLKSVMGAPKE